MKIVALSGASNIGKSKTIGSIADKILQNLKVNEKSYEKFLFPGENNNEKTVWVMDEQHNIGIGIISYGDYACELQRRLDEIIKKHKVDLLVCACRTKGGTKRYLNKLSNNILFINKSYLQNSNNNLSEIENSMNDNVANWIAENYYLIYKKI